MPFRDREALLGRALESVSALSYPNLEVILVDDASSDGSGIIARRFADSVPAATLVTLEQNVGAAEARNIGLERAKGEYIWFVDCDDEWEPSIISEMVSAALEQDADVVVCRSVRVLPSGRVLGACESIPKRDVISGQEAIDLVLDGKLKGYLWCKLFRTSILPTRPFPRIATQEDFCAVIPVLRKSSRVAFVHKALYRYIVWQGSLTNSRSIDLSNFDVQRKVMVQAADRHYAEGRPKTTRAIRYDLASWILLKAFTAARLKTAEDAQPVICALRTQIRLAEVLHVFPRHPLVASRALLLKLVGGRIIAVRELFVTCRDAVLRRRSSGQVSADRKQEAITGA